MLFDYPEIKKRPYKTVRKKISQVHFNVFPSIWQVRSDIVLTPTCFCGQVMTFHRRKNTRRCPNCGAQWKRDSLGFWAVNLRDVMFTPKDKFLNKRGAINQ
jgi:hypothetical protein